ncbi:MAG: apolipoprotein N-acyltransferase [Planctomycetia bacterium]|jgi:apolipoprotein N-acyltransferase
MSLRSSTLAFIGAIAMFLVQPPADLWMLAWLAPLPWLWIVQRDALDGRRPWMVLWAAGFLHWLLAIHWLRLPHPATSIGWVALSAYLAAYLPLFIWVARRLVHRRGWPLELAAPIAWMGCEQLRGWVLGGFTFAALGHTQWRWTMLLQAADLCGAVGVGGIVMAVAAGIAALLARPRSPIAYGAWRAATVVVGLPAIALAYGAWRLAEEPRSTRRPLDILLVQGSIDTELKHDPAAAEQVARHYDELTVRALTASGPRPDLVVWPETMWRWGLLEIDPAETLPESVVAEAAGSEQAEPDDQRQARARRVLEAERLATVGAFARRYATRWLVGLDRQVITPRAAGGAEHYNSALFLAADGDAIGRYDKMYPVMFGEYVPFADRFPWLYRLTPLPAGLTAGRTCLAVTIEGLRVAPTICYETALPEAVRSIVLDLEAAGGRPDVLVNLTNDGWFWGSSELDMHLAAGIFRAVEVRTPLVIAANTGFSAWIDGSGRLLARGPRRNTGTIRAKVEPDGRRSPWLAWGSVPTGLCVAVVAAAALETVAERKARRSRSGDALTGLPMQG